MQARSGLVLVRVFTSRNFHRLTGWSRRSRKAGNSSGRAGRRACGSSPAIASIPVPGGSRVTLSIQYSGPIGNLLGRLIGGINRRYIALEADGLKRRAEGQVHRA